jgi:uncharacterized membrane protein YcaP (DUF421 family)
MVTVIHAVLGYIFLVFFVRLLRRRPGGQMTMFEFVIIFLVGGVIILATMDDDRSMTNSTCAVMTVGMMHRLFAILKSHYPKFGAFVDGTPIVLVNNGAYQSDAMKNTNIDHEDVMAAARAQGIKSLPGIRYAVLERSGSISVIKAQQ